jgi:MscS family membrane protein
VGIIENIGVRSTQIRGRDRTLISIPNAKFADMEIINWAHCDKMLIKTTIGLRYETKPDQLRYVLANLREMFYSHPMIDTETVRVRFAGFGASSLDISIRVYALTREWNEFYAIQEDAFLRVSDVVLASGTDFAFPSQTLYICRDEGIDEERSNAVMDQVHKWRKSGKLPFPQMAQSRIDELTDSLDYPPKGSPDSVPREVQETDSSERLSAEDSDEAEGEINKKS